jgi:branched-chain amino acid aminotransferase
MSLSETWIWVDGAPRPAEQARVPVLDRGFLYGDSVYEVVRTFDGVPHLLGRHLDRLARSAAGLALQLPPREQIAAAVAATLAAVPRAPDQELERYLRIVVTRGAGALGLDPSLADAPRLIVIGRPLRLPPAEAYRDGVAVVLSSRVRSSPTLKTGNYLESVLATHEASLVQAHESLMRDSIGRVTEGSSSNFFLVFGGPGGLARLTTPSLAAGLLPGITRQWLIELARADGLAVDEAPVWPLDLQRADEMFLSSSIRGVLPVTRCEGRVVGDGRPGPVTKRVMALYASHRASHVGRA